MSPAPPEFSAVVPARLESTRLPRKALAAIGGVPLVVRVLRQVAKAKPATLVAATDSPLIKDAVEAAGFDALLTPPCPNGTARVAHAAKKLRLRGVVLNVQGDMPEIGPALLRRTAAAAAAGGCDVATAAAPITAAQARDPAVVKAVAAADGRALYFSRAAVPHGARRHLGHIGVYAFAPGRLARAAALPAAALAKEEGLEQLSWLAAGWRLRLLRAASFVAGVDTPADLARCRRRLGGA
ncbi:MAG: 3-deoxy-manno-octulosonate cytidylyltransferase [Betaproteobacteria bacterium AqS2]|uniref:3-deoxy-manno-octulosonate cytidylyltransferase n=1 Tax=Candidatus Amphirhobacter heronislandensis TaxID=1732024 RepID=A0A930XYG8_9GAMM|nr:3-deoxy-manno-octulosonate cytidylyltransferase [Betaproteobacteria bacterium AqS2]